MKTEAYKKFEVEFNQAEMDFNKNPNKKTATTLSNLRAKKWLNSEKYTPEYLKQMDVEEKQRMLRQKQRFTNLFNVIAIEEKIEFGQITRETGVTLHKINDTLNPLNL